MRSRGVVADAAILAGVLGFFTGGLLGIKKEVVDMLLMATVTGVIVFFAAFFIIERFMMKKYPEQFSRGGGPRKNVKKRTEGKKGEKKRGTRIDITVKDEDIDDIFNLK
ncbi:MAG TPA: hypothetical protein ENN43_04675 [bacterium]|nr:hypothetical protein [bacterium]